MSATNDQQLDRLVFFSDAVFAIAITLLVLEIEVPHVGHGGPSFGEEIIHLIPRFFAFVLSFLVIGRFWMSHHQVMGHVTTYDPRLMWPNLFYLMIVAFMPFSTAVLGANLGQFGPALFYNLTLLATAAAGWFLVWRIGSLQLGSDMDYERRGALGVLLGALVSVALTWLTPSLSQWGMVTIPLWIRLLKRWYSA